MTGLITEYRPIGGKLLAETLLASFGDPAAYPTEQDVPVELVKVLIEHMIEGEPFCDHSVGICACTERAVLEDLQLWVDGKRRCKRCGGDGIVISRSNPDLDEYCRCHGVTDSAGVVPIDWEEDAE